MTWNTDIATTAASMSAGTWTLDDPNNLLYVWATDGADPDTHTMSVTRRSNGIIATGGNKNYISIDSIEIRYANDHNLDVNGNDYWVITNVTSHGSYSKGISFNSSIDTTISYCTVYNNVARTDGYAGVGGSSVTTALISHNTIYNNNYGTNSDGIQVSGDGIVIEYNEVYGHANGGSADNIQISGTGHSTVRFNKLYDGRVGVIVTAATAYTDIYDNISYNNYYGINLSSVGGGNTTVYNNTVYQNNATPYSAIKISAVASPNTVTIKNNIFYNSGSGYALYEVSTVDATLLTLNNNLYYGVSGSFIGWEGTDYSVANFANYKTASSQDANSLNSDPLFTDASGLFNVASDFILQSTSPAINAGVGVGLTVDYAGNVVPECPKYGFDIGAYEYQRTCPGGPGFIPLPNPPLPVTDVTVSSGNGQINLSWNNPNGASTPVLVFHQRGFPILYSDYQNQIYSGTNSSYTDINLTNGETYYYSIYTTDSYGQISSAVNVSAVPSQGISNSQQSSTSGGIAAIATTPVTPTAPITSTPSSLESIQLKINNLITKISLLSKTPSTEDLNTIQTEIVSILNELKSIQTFLPAEVLTKAGATIVPVFTTGLYYGLYSDNVRKLQEVLKQDKEVYLEGVVNGKFGPATLRAVKRFQLKYSITTENNPGYGYVGPKTRQVLNQMNY